jgi:hypothetical protein
MTLFDLSEFEISGPRCPTHYFSAGNDEVLHIVVKKISECQMSLSLIFWTQITYQ